jgi:protein TonB
VLIAMVVGLLLAAGATAFVLMRGKGNAPAATTASNTIAPATTSAAATQTLVPAAGTTTALVPTATTATTQTGIDQSAVDQEVARRMAAERERLAAQARAQQPPQTATTQTAAPVVPRPAPVQDAPATATQAPPPPVETRPAPQPVQQPETPAETRPAPAQQQPAVARAREGDLVPAGTAGLIPPRITRRGAVNYPQVAKAQRLQGTVITSVLVSETGDVLDVRVIRGVNGPGLNEAAIQAMRRSSFPPAMKDGVRVRSYLTVPVEFKL